MLIFRFRKKSNYSNLEIIAAVAFQLGGYFFSISTSFGRGSLYQKLPKACACAHSDADPARSTINPQNNKYATPKG